MRYKKIILLVILLIGFGPIRAVERWADNTYAYQPELTHSSYDTRNMSASQMSAQNFVTLSEQGATATSTGPRKVGRPDEPAIGDADFHSPIGDSFIPLLLCLLGYTIKKCRKYHILHFLFAYLQKKHYFCARIVKVPC